jgi:hypothetical protein
VRRDLLKSWPAITKFYGLFPWDMERLTVDELNEYLSQMDDVQRERELERKRAKR